MAENRIKVLIVDDHEMVRLGLSAYLQTEPDITVIGEAENGLAALEFAAPPRLMSFSWTW